MNSFPNVQEQSNQTPSPLNDFLAEGGSSTENQPMLRKFVARLDPGQTRYRLKHNFGTSDVLVQTRISGRVREGGISIKDENTVEIEFGGNLNEPMDVVIIG
jgi:hypothetical protein